MSTGKKRKYTSLENALRVLKSFSEDHPEMGVHELADRLDIAASTTHRLLSTLVEEGFVVKNPSSNKYTLGLSVLRLTHTVTDQLKIIKEASPILEKLTEETGESSHIGILDGNHVIYLQKVNGEHPVKLDSHLGKRNPIHCTSSGLANLAFQPSLFIDEILWEPLKAFTERTITDPDKLRQRLSTIRNTGYVISDREFKDKIMAIGAPVYKSRRDVIASINIAGPENRIRPRKKIHTKKVLEASSSLSQIITERHRRK